MHVQTLTHTFTHFISRTSHLLIAQNEKEEKGQAYVSDFLTKYTWSQCPVTQVVHTQTL